MSAKKPQREKTEDFVRRVLTETFKQHVDKDTLREVSAKVSAVIPTEPPAPKDDRKRSEKAA